MKTFQTIEAAANLKGMAKHTYNRVMSAMAEDTTAAMLHAFAALTDGAKAIALQSGKFSNLYIRGERKGMAVEEAAKELTERAAAGVTRKLRKIDHICAVDFLTEYIARQRKADETPETPATDNTPTAMNANEKYNYLEAVTADVLNYIDENNITVTTENRDEIEQQLNDDLWAVDSVTGNASGSYTFSIWQAEKNICHNLDLLAEACEEFGSDAAKLLNDGAEACDVTIRCYLLGQAISAALDEVETEEEEEEPEEDTEA